MRVIPAIDLKDGQCVRLQKGDYGTAHKVAENPVETAQRFLDAGADLVHMVDLDAANGRFARELRRGGAGHPRDRRDRGAWRRHPLHAGCGDRACTGCFARDHRLGGCPRPGIRSRGCKKVRRQDRCRHRCQERDRPHGRLAGRQRRELHRVRRAHGSIGVRHIIFTDIDKDGMLAGPNFDQLAALRASVSCEIIASGGVSTLEDIAGLKKLGIDGAIAGKAVYTGTLDLAKAIEQAK